MNTKYNVNAELSYEINLLRGLACFLIVGVHVSANAFNYELNQFSGTIPFLMNQVGRIGTPIFAFLSAMLLFGSLKKNKAFDVKRFFTTRMSKIVVPYFFCSVFYVFFALSYLGRPIPGDITVWLEALLLGEAFYHLYFIFTILQFYLLFPFLAKIKRRAVFLGLTIVSFMVTMSFSLYWPQPWLVRVGLLGELIAKSSFIFHWWFFFMAGGLFALYYPTLRGWERRNPAYLFSALLIILVGLGVSLDTKTLYPSHRAANVILVPLLCVVALLLATSIKGKRLSTCKLLVPIHRLGSYSMGVYFLHPAIIVITAFYTSVAWAGVNLVLLTGAITLACCAVIVVFNKVPYGRYVLPIAGR